MKETLARTGRGIRWYLRQATGEAKWDQYVEDCRRHEHEPVSRREFERRRSEAKEGSAGSHCC